MSFEVETIGCWLLNLLECLGVAKSYEPIVNLGLLFVRELKQDAVISGFVHSG